MRYLLNGQTGMPMLPIDSFVGDCDFDSEGRTA